MDQTRDRFRKKLAREKPGSNGDGHDDKIEPVYRCFADVKPGRVEWLWKARIPRGMLSLCDGDPGNGKSTMSCDIAARVSRGWAMPPESNDGPVTEAAGVLLLNGEDDPERTIRPRLDAAGADVKRIHILTGIRLGADDERPPVLPYDLPLIENLIHAEAIALIVIDPFMAFLASDIDAHRDADVRRCFHCMKALAEKNGVAILIIRHLNKLSGGPAIYRGGGSIGITGAVRSAMVVGKDPQNPEHCVLTSVKSNLAPKPASLIYTHEPAGDVARIGWVGETDLSADDILERPKREKQGTAERCAEAMRQLLTGRDMETTKLTAALTAMGYSERTIERARGLVGVRGYRAGFGAEGQWMLGLRTTEDHRPPTQ
jgi:hypothetical protein